MTPVTMQQPNPSLQLAQMLQQQASATAASALPVLPKSIIGDPRLSLALAQNLSNNRLLNTNLAAMPAPGATLTQGNLPQLNLLNVKSSLDILRQQQHDAAVNAAAAAAAASHLPQSIPPHSNAFAVTTAEFGAKPLNAPAVMVPGERTPAAGAPNAGAGTGTGPKIKSRSDIELRRMQNREAAQRHRAKHMRERKEKEAENIFLKAELADRERQLKHFAISINGLITSDGLAEPEKAKMVLRSLLDVYNKERADRAAGRGGSQQQEAPAACAPPALSAPLPYGADPSGALQHVAVRSPDATAMAAKAADNDLEQGRKALSEKVQLPSLLTPEIRDDPSKSWKWSTNDVLEKFLGLANTEVLETFTRIHANARTDGSDPEFSSAFEVPLGAVHLTSCAPSGAEEAVFAATVVQEAQATPPVRRTLYSAARRRAAIVQTAPATTSPPASGPAYVKRRIDAAALVARELVESTGDATIDLGVLARDAGAGADGEASAAQLIQSVRDTFAQGKLGHANITSKADELAALTEQLIAALAALNAVQTSNLEDITASLQDLATLEANVIAASAARDAELRGTAAAKIACVHLEWPRTSTRRKGSPMACRPVRAAYRSRQAVEIDGVG